MKMKKFGFTLAEILVTLAIVGVVAALTVPSLNVNVSNQKLGPTLAKFSSEFENGINLYMIENDIPKFDMGQFRDARKQWAISEVQDTNGHLWTLKSGGTMGIADETECIPTSNDTTIGTIVGLIEYDINGAAAPNEPGKDMFYFVVSSSGHLFPVGGQTLYTDLQNGGYSEIPNITIDEGELNNNAKKIRVGFPVAIADIKPADLDEAAIAGKAVGDGKTKSYGSFAAGRIADNGWTTKGLPVYK